MKTRSTYTIVIMIAITLLLPFRQGKAHDDGLTCHKHPVHGGGSGPDDLCVIIFNDNNDDINNFVDVGVLQHKFENLAANKLEDRSAKCKRQDVSTVMKGISEFSEMVEIVRRLVIRAERFNDKAEKEDAIVVARHLFDSFSISKFINFDIFLKKNRHSASVMVSTDTFINFLIRQYEIPDSLVIIVRNASQSC